MIYENVDKYDRVTSQYIVAYLDILGVASRMQLDKESQIISLNKLHNLYKHVMDLCQRGIGIESFVGIETKIFSDNIIIVKRLSVVPEKRMSDIKSIFNCVSLFQCTAASDSVGWLVRGGITLGELYLDETMVWGAALLKAYELENSIAIYPRVLIDSLIVSEVEKNAEIAEYILADFDNMYFLNYLNVQHYGGRFLKGGFQMMQDELQKTSGEYSNRIYQKLCWHMNYINNELDKKKERGEGKYRLSIN